ncbi:MAG: flotillin family protein [Victivallaceae bacterium]|nr:SPFH domain-containing protein [Victivallaceae bacterium]
MEIIVYIVLAAFVLMALFAMLATRYRKCPSDRIMVIYGKTGGNQAARCIHGGAKFIIPVIQDYGYISLRPLQIDVKLDNALCQQNIRINVPSVFTVGVSTRPEIMGNAAERLFGQTPEAIQELSKDIIFGQLRLVIASMTIEEINADRETFLRAVETNVAEELNKIGLELLNVNITDITDESGYIDAIGKRAASEAINRAKIDVSEEVRKGSTGEAEAKKQERIAVADADAKAISGEARAAQERRIAVAQAETAAVSGEAEAAQQRRIAIAQAETTAVSGEATADQQRRIAVKQADSTATQGENLSAVEIAKSNASRTEQEAEAYRRGEAARRVAAAQVEQAQFDAEKVVQISRAAMEMEKQNAEIIVAAEIKKKQIEIEAEAQAEKLRREAKGQADAIFAKLEAEARGNFEILKAKGEGYRQIIDACGKSGESAGRMLLIEKLQDIVAMQTEAIRNIKIDKVTVWDNGGKTGDGKTATANFLSGMVQSLPPLHDVAKMAGLDLPEYLGKVKDQEKTEEKKS